MQQKALLIPTPKADFVLGSHDVPSPGKDEVLVKIMSVALNPMTYLQREYDVLVDEYPAVLGSDMAGMIEEVGEDVRGFSKGDRVFAGGLGGGLQQYVAVPAAALFRMPQNLTFDEASTAPITFSTACVGLFAPAPIGAGLNPTFSWEKPQQGKSALVIGASTSTGQYVIQLLKFLGFTKIVAYASLTHVEYLRQLGATEFIDRHTVPLDSISTDRTLTEKVKVVYDATSTGAIDVAYDCVAQGGAIVTVQPRVPTTRSNDTVSFTRVLGYYAGPDVANYKSEVVRAIAGTPAHTVFGKQILKNLPELFEKGVIVPNRVEIVPNGLAGVPEALERMKAGGVSGVKLVAHPQDTK
ncbi:chaperonin 10-like protein [Mycena rebaudengoi]|nr:chaperonin 10-like protein [Mycena rebaudengoi]